MWKASALTFSVVDRNLVSGVDLEIRSGEVLAVLGPNGAGKSTLFRLLTGEIDPSAGTVEVDGKKRSTLPPLEQAQRCAVMPQQCEIPFPLTVEEVVLMGRTPYFGWSERPIDKKIAAEAMQRLDLAGMEQRQYPTLSGGEKQRVQFARALAQLGEPAEWPGKYLFLDEPASSLDLKHQHDLFRLTRELAQGGVGVFAVLHDLNLAALYADRLLLLQRGSVVICDGPEVVLDPVRIEAVFGQAVVVVRHPERNCPQVLSR
jgi:iron complex transport system ATP-binding protein